MFGKKGKKGSARPINQSASSSDIGGANPGAPYAEPVVEMAAPAPAPAPAMPSSLGSLNGGGAPASQQMVRAADGDLTRTDGHGVWDAGSRVQRHMLQTGVDTSGLANSTGNKFVPKDAISGSVPPDWQKDARLGRIEAVDAQVDSLHRALDQQPDATVNVSAGCLLPGERVVSELHCIGFVNWPAKDDQTVGDCRVVLTQTKENTRRLMLVSNEKTLVLEAEESFDFSNTTGGCCMGGGSTGGIKGVRNYKAVRSGAASFGVVSVDNQLLSCTSEVVTKTRIEKSLEFVPEPRQQPEPCCESCIPGCSKDPCCGLCALTSCLCKLACKACKPKTEEGKVDYKMAATDKEKTLEQIVSTTDDSKDPVTKLNSKTTQTRYYGLNLVWADPAKQKLVEVIAIAQPQTGQQQLAAFVGAVAHDLRAPEIYPNLVAANRDLRKMAQGKSLGGFGAGLKGKK
jgi:hypothetical protein